MGRGLAVNAAPVVQTCGDTRIHYDLIAVGQSALLTPALCQIQFVSLALVTGTDQ